MKRVFLFLTLGLICIISVTNCDDNDLNIGEVPMTGINADRESISRNVRYSSSSDNVKYYPVPANATNVAFKVESKDPSVATITETGLGVAQVTVLKPGSTVVTISSGGVTKEIPVTGVFEVTKLTEIRLELDIEPVEGTDSTQTFVVPVGDVVQVKASANPRNANTETADYVTFDWKSNNTNVATVEEDASTTIAVDKIGAITVVGTGEAKITVSWTEELKEGAEESDRKSIKARTIIIKGVRADG
jgi:hypothetical protein